MNPTPLTISTFVVIPDTDRESIFNQKIKDWIPD